MYTDNVPKRCSPVNIIFRRVWRILKGVHVRFDHHEQCSALESVLATLLPVTRRSRVSRYDAQSFLWMAHHRADRLFALKTGRVEITAEDTSGNQMLLRVVAAGQVFGELCFCEYQCERLGTLARAMTRCQVIELSRATLWDEWMTDPRIAAGLIQTFCLRLGEAEQRIGILAIRDARVRLGSLLLHLARRRTTETVPKVSLSVSHAELAALAALTRAHTTVLMTRFRTEGLVEYSRGSALTIHLNRLKQSVESAHD